jgi:hypothetical protein
VRLQAHNNTVHLKAQLHLRLLEFMTITVKFFASLRERVGKSEASLITARGLSLQEIW